VLGASICSPFPVTLFPASPFCYCLLILKTSSKFTKKLLVATFVVYIAVVAGLTIVPTRLGRFRIPDPDHINLLPLNYSFKCFELARKIPALMSFCLRNTLGNIALFVPLGILLPLVTVRLRSLKRVLLLALCMSLTIETIQLVLRFVGSPRAVDIDDVILNTLGACVGFVIYRSAAKGEKA
jgi:glycopeptide antibiotics resistance protein